ncbi:MipA/OmpV family protein [Xanthobacter sp. TB0136]|uniref:MipA/OmpV family protein n=1 Tax=Xanthobacter sp. TB0136 TaxID=3459177 RepID=UPI004039E343
MSAYRCGRMALLAMGFSLGLGTAAQAADFAFGEKAATPEDWYITIGARGIMEPSYPGSDSYKVRPGLILSIARASERNVFHSVDDNPSIALWNSRAFRAGIVGRLDWGRSESDSDRLRGMGDVDFSIEAGGFAEFYPMDWLRLRAELRYGMGGFDGLRGDLRADAIFREGPWRFAVGPRLSYASSGYMDTYYGVTAEQSFLSTLLLNPLPTYKASSGFDKVGATAQLNYTFNNGFEAGIFGSYGYLLSDAADSPLVEDKNQFTAGVSLSYTFNMGPGLW